MPDEINLKHIDSYPYKDYPKKRYGSIEDDLLINTIKLNKNYENLEEKDICAPIMGKLALNSIIKNLNNPISKPCQPPQKPDILYETFLNF